jgi:hypothetical protein
VLSVSFVRGTVTGGQSSRESRYSISADVLIDLIKKHGKGI